MASLLKERHSARLLSTPFRRPRVTQVGMRLAERRLLIVTTAGLIVAWAVFLLSVLDPRGEWAAETFGPPEDGGWVAASIDDRWVERPGFTLSSMVVSQSLGMTGAIAGPVSRTRTGRLGLKPH